MPYDECNVAQCIIIPDKYIRSRGSIENQYAALLGIASVALPNRDLLFHLSDIEGHELNTMARDLYKVLSSAQNNLKKYAPRLKKGDVLFWHPFTIHGSWNQKNELYSRKSLTAHYHPVGSLRMDSAENQNLVKKYIKKMRDSSNPAIYFDNSDPSNFRFTTISFAKWILKKFLLNGKDLRRGIMNREILK